MNIVNDELQYEPTEAMRESSDAFLIFTQDDHYASFEFQRQAVGGLQGDGKVIVYDAYDTFKGKPCVEMVIKEFIRRTWGVDNVTLSMCKSMSTRSGARTRTTVSYTHLRAH